MTRQELEHLVRAAVDIVHDEVVVIGSQAILAEVPLAPASLLRSMEADVYPLSNPDGAELLDAMIGDGSRFHEVYGYYAHGVGPETVVGPKGWEERRVRLEVPTGSKTGSAVAWCIERHDLVLAKLAAGRMDDWAFAEDAIRAGIVDIAVLRERAETMPPERRESALAAVEGVIERAGR